MLNNDVVITHYGQKCSLEIFYFIALINCVKTMFLPSNLKPIGFILDDLQHEKCFIFTDIKTT